MMFARTISRVIVLAVLTLQLFAFAAEAAVCVPGHAELAGCPSYSETASSSSPCAPGGRDESSCPAHDREKGRCPICPICLAPFIEASPVSVSPHDLVQRIAPAEFATLYEAPSFPLLRPPIA